MEIFSNILLHYIETYDLNTKIIKREDTLYFKATDIEEFFELRSIKKEIKDPVYIINKDYIYIQKMIYLTYRGVIKCLFNNDNEKAESFQDWCLKILFTNQFGNLEEKQILSSKLLGVHIKTIKEVFNTSATDIPCIYLFTLGTAKDLRKSIKLDGIYGDDMIICKYGHTNNLSRRASEHSQIYGGIKNANLYLKYYAYIDPQYISNAESDLSDYFNDMGCKIQYENHKELIILDNTKLNKLVKHFERLSNQYAGHIKDLTRKIEDLEKKYYSEIQIEKHKNEIQMEKHKNELLERELKNLRESNEKDKLLFQYQIQLSQNNNNKKKMK